MAQDQFGKVFKKGSKLVKKGHRIAGISDAISQIGPALLLGAQAYRQGKIREENLGIEERRRAEDVAYRERELQARMDMARMRSSGGDYSVYGNRTFTPPPDSEMAKLFGRDPLPMTDDLIRFGQSEMTQRALGTRAESTDARVRDLAGITDTREREKMALDIAKSVLGIEDSRDKRVTDLARSMISASAQTFGYGEGEETAEKIVDRSRSILGNREGSLPLLERILGGVRGMIPSGPQPQSAAPALASPAQSGPVSNVTPGPAPATALPPEEVAARVDGFRVLLPKATPDMLQSIATLPAQEQMEAIRALTAKGYGR